MKTLAALALVALLGIAGCAHPDPTPERYETAAVAKVAHNVVCTPIALVFGVVTWPIPIVSLVTSPADDPWLALAAAGWPITCVYLQWTL